MKLKSLLTLLLITISTSAFCTIWTINTSGLTFTPATTNILFGDTVVFTIGGSHDAREVSLGTWTANGNTPLPGGFQTAFGGGMVLPAQLAVGTHYFVCTPHAAMGMKGTIIVSPCPTPAQPGLITGNTAICSGTSNTYSISPVAGATSYTWTLPGGWSGTSSTTSITTTSSATSGNISVTANVSCGSSVPQTLAITVTSIPPTPAPITGNTTICTSTSNTYSVVSIPSATSYTWAYPVGWTGTSTTNSIATTCGSLSGNITVTAINSCGSSPLRTVAITVVNSIPNTPTIVNGNSDICALTVNSYNVASEPGATSYLWSLPLGWTGSSTTNTISATSSVTSGNITIAAVNVCGSSTPQTLTINVANGVLAQPTAINGNAGICASTTNTYDILPLVGATSYTWTMPIGWSGSSTTNSINTTSSATSGNVTVTANNICGASPAQTLAINTTSIPATPSIIQGNAVICENSTNFYSVTNDPNAVDYSWTLPASWTGTTTVNSIPTASFSTGGDILVTANNICGSSAPQILNVTVTIIDTSVIQSLGILASNSFVGTYQWIDCFDNSFVTNETDQVFIPSTNGDYAVINTQSGCADTSFCFTISGLALNENALNTITISPNPSNGIFSINSANLDIIEVEIEIYNLQGTVVYKASTFANESIDLCQQPKGIYLLKVKSGNKVLTNKIILD
jgi:plastocyanin